MTHRTCWAKMKESSPSVIIFMLVMAVLTGYATFESYISQKASLARQEMQVGEESLGSPLLVLHSRDLPRMAGQRGKAYVLKDAKHRQEYIVIWTTTGVAVTPRLGAEELQNITE